jgi:hypothetical protein
MSSAQYLAAIAVLSLCGYAMAERPIPNTLEEAFSYLDASLKPDQRLAFMHRSESDAVAQAHFAVGLFIRNQWLRSGESALTEFLQAAGAQSFDDMSSMILTSYWRHLHGRPIELEKQGTCYRSWALEQERLIDEAKKRGENSYSTPGFDC